MASSYADWLQRGRVHQWEGRPVDAIPCFQRAAALEPRAADPRYLLGEVHWQLGAIPAAVAAWREAVRVAPTHLASRLALSEALLALGDIPAARDAAAEALALVPQDLDANVLHAVSAFATGSVQDVLQRLAPLLVGNPGRLASLAPGGTLARALGEQPEAPGAVDVMAALAPHAMSVQMALLVPMARAALRDDAPEPLRASSTALAQAGLERPLGQSDLDVLRALALEYANAGDATTAALLATRHAHAVVAMTPPGAPLLWPQRTAGDALRVHVLMPQDESRVARALLLLEDVAKRVPGIEWTWLSGSGCAVPAANRSVVRVLPQVLDTAVASAMARDDADVLLDAAGLSLASGIVLALRPARTMAGVALDMPAHALPLVDATLPADPGAIAAWLTGQASHVAASPRSPMTASELSAAFDRAVDAHRDGHHEAAQADYEAVLSAQPLHPQSLHLLGSLLRERKDFDAAAALLGRAVDAAPWFSDARVSAARLARDRGSVDEGLALVDAGLERQPQAGALWRVRGELELARQDGVAAETAFARALALAPTDAEAHYNLGVALQMQGKRNDAARAYQRALAFDAGFADAHFNLGVLFQEGRIVDAAVSAYRAVLARDPRRVAAYKHLGETLLGAARIDDWLANFRQFEVRCPDALPLAVQALEVCQYAADAPALERYLEGLRRERFKTASALELADALEQLLYLLLFFDVEPAMIHRFAQTYDSTAREVYGGPMPRTAQRAAGKLRIGYLSADLRNHVMGKMMFSALRHHDRDRFALHFYSLSTVNDEWTERFMGIADRFEVVAGLPERIAADRIATDDLDLLVDLSTHTLGAKPGILARKPARVQLTHVASAGSVGMSCVDFKLTDAFADLPSSQESTIETLLPMAGCVYPYRHVEPANDHPFHRSALRIADDAIVIGAFVAPMKLSRRCLSLWRDVLARVPRARLAFSPTHPALRTVYERLTASAGIAPERLLFLPQGRDDAQNQARYGLVDFVLDPMPFGGVNGVLEPLDAGVPVVTLVGKRHGERSAYSILANLGVMQTMAQGGREYVEIATRLAEDRAFASEVREGIRRGLASSPLVDMPAHTRNLEAAYLHAIQTVASRESAKAAHG